MISAPVAPASNTRSVVSSAPKNIEPSMSNIKAIILDIDGVINPSRKKNSYCLDYNLPNVLAKKLNHPKIATLNAYLVNQVYYCFSKESILLLKQLIEKYDAQIVTIEGIKYLSFNTNHFSNYIIASNNVVNPNTLDNIGLYFEIMALSLGVIVILVIKSNKKLKR